MEIKMKYKDLGNFEFSQTVAKIANTPTTAQKAKMIRDLVKLISDAKEAITKAFTTEIVEVFAKRDDKGQIVRPEGEPNGFDVDETKFEEFNKTQADFGEREHVFAWRPFTPSLISDVKMSAREIELLKDLFSDEEGPGIPMGNFGSMGAQTAALRQ